MGKKTTKETVENIVLDNSKKDKLDAVQAAIKQMEKKYGAGICQRLGDQASLSVEKLSTGILPLDLAIGIGGLPKGRIIEIYGPESAGKTLIALQTAAETQKNDGVVAYIDVEHALNVDFARRIGVNVDELIVTQPDSGEQALEVAEALIRSGGIDLIVMDSVAALTPQAEIDGEMGDAHVGLLARLLSQGLRKITSIISKTNTTMIFINQLRDKVGVIYGNPETTPGGRALKFYASVRLDVRKKEPIKNGSEIVGNRVKVKVVKNKVAPPFKECEFDLMFSSGVSKSGSIIDIAVELGIIDKAGSWFSYNGNKIGQGREAVKNYLDSNIEVAKEITSKIYEEMAKLGSATETETPITPNTEILDTYGVEIPQINNGDSDDFESFDPIKTEE